MTAAGVEKIKIFICGDVMTGRGIDQILSHPANPQIYESYLTDARDYVRLAESTNGQIPYPVDDNYLWGDALNEWQLRQPQLKLINLETSVTRHDIPWPHKGINYRMHPNNITVLTAANINVCTLANNHTLDWNVEGLRETLSILQKSHIAYAGAGENIVEAQKPAIFPISKRHILVFSMGLRSSGIPHEWQATQNRPGVWLLDDLKDSFRQVQEKFPAIKNW
ncbi:CapA family protein [Legionella tunisiensis]|uniref:CapA family protein n=1 Tax=Legionella tunisiensis TaxID=1034944 RepID=UPI00030538BF|nr:CapA family protein [Legionella tunisiensis]